MNYSRELSLSVALALCPPLLTAQESWPQFRGPTGQGTSTAKGLPTHWSETNNITWKTAIPGSGHSSPVIMKNEIWLTSAMDGGRARNVVTVDFKTGKIIRNKTLYTVDKVERCNGLNSYATPTPIMEDGRVYVTFGAAGTACLSAGTGEVIWQRTDFKVTYFTVGAASSPSIHKNALIVICDGERNSERFVAALDKMTGKTLWKTDRTYKDGKLPQITHSFSVPLAITVDGKDQVICPGAHGVYAYDGATGKEIWVARYGGWSVVSRPVYAGGMLYICNGVVKPLLYCIDPKGAKGDITETDRIIWKTEDMVPNMPSPLVVNNRFYTMTASKLACRKPKTGEIIERAYSRAAPCLAGICRRRHLSV